MVYSNTQDVRELARSLLVADFPDAEILEEQEAAQSKIHTITRKSNWTSTDIEYNFIKKLEQKQAAIYILEHYDTSTFDNVLQNWKIEIDEGLAKVVESRTDESFDAPITVVSSNYDSYPLSLEDDDQAQPYRSSDIHV